MLTKKSVPSLLPEHSNGDIYIKEKTANYLLLRKIKMENIIGKRFLKNEHQKNIINSYQIMLSPNIIHLVFLVFLQNFRVNLNHIEFLL